MAKGIVKGGLNDSGGGSGGDTSDATALASDITAGKTAYIAVGKVTGTLVPGAALYLNEVIDTLSVSKFIDIESDCYFNSSVTLSDFVITGTTGITSVTYLDTNHVRFVMTEQAVNTAITIKAFSCGLPS